MSPAEIAALVDSAGLIPHGVGGPTWVGAEYARTLADGVAALVTALAEVTARAERTEAERNSARLDGSMLVLQLATATAERDAAVARAERAEAFARDCRDNYDCDEDAHRYGTSCRACNAAALLGPAVAP